MTMDLTGISGLLAVLRSGAGIGKTDTESTREAAGHPRSRWGAPRRAEGPPPRERSALDLRIANVTRETEFRFQVTTDEGDVVTITGSSEESRTYGSLRYRDRDEDGATRLTARFREIELDEEFSITVEGDLSEEELADIRKLVNEIRPALASGGKAGGIPIRALDASRFESLARFELFLEQSITRTLVHARLRRDGNGDVLPPPEPGMPAPPPAA